MYTSVVLKIRRGDGPVFGAVKAAAKRVMCVSIPVGGPLKHVFRFLYHAHVAVREAWIWGVRFFWYEPLFRSMCESVGERFHMEMLPYMVGRGRIVIGSDVRLSGKCEFGFTNRVGEPLPEVEIGDGSFVGHECIFAISKGVRIGKRCLMASGVRVFDHDGHPIDAECRRRGELAPVEASKAVEIGDDVWIGARAAIMKGVRIGDRSIVGTSAVVTRDVPADVVVAGNPARIVKELGPAGARGGGSGAVRVAVPECPE